MPANTVLPRRLTKSEAARRLGIDIRVVNKLIQKGEIRTAAKVANENHIVLEDSVDAMLARMAGQVSQAG